jgi:acyl-CoA synthetase (AMP-forming)/AMP-acid ligase II
LRGGEHDTGRADPAGAGTVDGARRAGVAYADSARGVTYAELERRTRALAGYLTRTGLARGDRVAICLGNCVEMVESCLAVLRAGMVGVPLDPRSSDAELAHFLRDSGAAFVITDTPHLVRLRRLGSPYDRLGALVTGPGPAPEGARLFRSAAESDGPAEIDTLGLDDPAWMLYTSGTTHRPKGVLSTQRAALWSVAACYAPLFGLSSADRLLWPLPLFHSFSHSLAILGVTAVGASARIAGSRRRPAVCGRSCSRRTSGSAGPSPCWPACPPRITGWSARPVRHLGRCGCASSPVHRAVPLCAPPWRRTWGLPCSTRTAAPRPAA